VVGESGRVIEEKVTRPLGMGLDQNAMDAVRKWRFKPGTIDDKPTTMPVTVEVKFQLQ
jgi:TonB family protein